MNDPTTVASHASAHPLGLGISLLDSGEARLEANGRCSWRNLDRLAIHFVILIRRADSRYEYLARLGK